EEATAEFIATEIQGFSRRLAVQNQGAGVGLFGKVDIKARRPSYIIHCSGRPVGPGSIDDAFVTGAAGTAGEHAIARRQAIDEVVSLKLNASRVVDQTGPPPQADIGQCDF